VSTPPLEGAPLHALDTSTATALWEHLLARQGLAPHTRLAAATDIADAALGLHAARLPSPYAILAARAADPAIPATLFASAVHQRLLTVRCMRKTLHTLPLALAAAAHAATLRFRARDAARAVLNAGITRRDLEHATTQLLLVLQDGPLGHRVIEQRLTASGVPVPVTRLAIKTAWEHGHIVYRNTTRAWNREIRTFAIPSAYPHLDLDQEPGEALAVLVGAYFDRYGPATLRDATWWSGLSRAEILTGLAATGRPTMRITTPWANDTAIMLTDRYEEFRATPHVPTGVNFLAHEDTALKAYFQTRTRYLGPLPQHKAFNQIGEVLPTVLIDGRVAGTWTFSPATRTVKVSLLRGTAPRLRRAIAERADELAATLRAAWTARPATQSTVPTGQLALTELAQ
jgi:Winged helix DNA-binding domain